MLGCQLGTGFGILNLSYLHFIQAYDFGAGVEGEGSEGGRSEGVMDCEPTVAYAVGGESSTAYSHYDGRALYPRKRVLLFYCMKAFLPLTIASPTNSPEKVVALHPLTSKQHS